MHGRPAKNCSFVFDFLPWEGIQLLRELFDSLASGNNDIWVIGSEGGTPRQVTADPSNEGRPFWSHDGRWIYFRSDRSGSKQGSTDYYVFRRRRPAQHALLWGPPCRGP